MQTKILDIYNIRIRNYDNACPALGGRANKKPDFRPARKNRPLRPKIKKVCIINVYMIDIYG
ncbi:MAG: hypothetical protein IJ809_07305 [Clostridia bacterium]|nr:hypothetical protein [Clostridia bacterium]